MYTIISLSTVVPNQGAHPLLHELIVQEETECNMKCWSGAQSTVVLLMLKHILTVLCPATGSWLVLQQHIHQQVGAELNGTRSSSSIHRAAHIHSQPKQKHRKNLRPDSLCSVLRNVFSLPGCEMLCGLCSFVDIYSNK